MTPKSASSHRTTTILSSGRRGMMYDECVKGSGAWWQRAKTTPVNRSVMPPDSSIRTQPTKKKSLEQATRGAGQGQAPSKKTTSYARLPKRLPSVWLCDSLTLRYYRIDDPLTTFFSPRPGVDLSLALITANLVKCATFTGRNNVSRSLLTHCTEAFLG